MSENRPLESPREQNEQCTKPCQSRTVGLDPGPTVSPAESRIKTAKLGASGGVQAAPFHIERKSTSAWWCGEFAPPRQLIHMPSSFSQRSRLIDLIDPILEREYQSPRHGNLADPTSELIYVLLSVRTRIESVRPFVLRPMKRVPAMDKMADAAAIRIQRAIEPLGLSQKRSEQLLQIATRVRGDFGTFCLKRLKRMPTEEALDDSARLTRCGGEGCTMCRTLLACAELAPMDVNATRVLTRVGALPRTATPEKAYKLVDRLMAPEVTYRLHVNLVAHGKKCRARNPACSVCSLIELCRYAIRGR